MALDALLNNLDLAGIAQKVGLDPAQAQGAIAALTQAHGQPGDTVADAAQSTGLSTDTLSQLVSQIGGENALGQLAQSIGGGGAGGALGDIAGGLFGKK